MFKFCPQCKSSEISSHNNHQFVCANCQFEYFHNAAATVAGIVICQGEILFTIRGREPGKGLLDLPGGFVDHHESLEQALTREFKEEVGLNITQWQYLQSGHNTYLYNGITYRTCDAVFVAEFDVRPEVRIDNDEITSFKWINMEDIPLEQMAFVSLRDILSRFIKI